MSVPEASPTLLAEGLCRNFGDRVAVADLSFELRRGEVLGLLGPNGAGKTTTMRMLTGNLRPDAGRVMILGTDLAAKPLEAKRGLGFLPETPPLYRDFSVDHYLKFAARLHRVEESRIAGALEDAKKKCGLLEVGRRLIGSLSKGFQQRVGIAQAIIHQPEVIILDEPTVGLDPNQIREIRQLIRELGNRHSVIFSTHILSEVEAVCDRVQILNHGRLVYGGDIGSIRTECSLELGLRNPPPISELEQIPGVIRAAALSPTRFRLHHQPEDDFPDRLIKLAAEKGWALQSIAPVRSTLEEVFSGLTEGAPEQ